MKKAIIQILAVLICSIFIVSCDNDDNDLQVTGINGKPSGIKYDNTNAFFYYQGSKLSRIKEIKGSILDFKYENNELVSISYSPEDKGVQDGIGSTVFRKEGSNKIIIESSGAPSFSLYRHELEVNENNIPIKITEVGIYDRTGTSGELSKVMDGKYYAVFTYDSDNKNLIKQTLYNKSTSEIVTTYDYEYDNNLGIMSKIDLPLWFYAYKAYGARDFRNTYNRIYFNYCNNVIKETISDVSVTRQNVFNYNYQYNKADVPISMGGDTPNHLSISITY